jgi:Tfp pilus assembly major pilin PilA
MSLKDKPLFENVLSMNMAVVASVITVIAMAFVFFVFAKNNFMNQAKERVEKAQTEAKHSIAQAMDNIENNRLLWTLVDSTWRSSDKSKAFVKKLSDSQKLPRCKGKPCDGDEARLKTEILSNEKERSIKVRGGKYYFKVLYDNKEKFVTIDVNDLLHKTSAVSLEEPADDDDDSEE